MSKILIAMCRKLNVIKNCVNNFDILFLDVFFIDLLNIYRKVKENRSLNDRENRFYLMRVESWGQ